MTTRTRVRKLNPAEPCGGRKPADQITDRALRYRANSEECQPDGPLRCMWCGASEHLKANSRAVLEVGHIDGDETNTRPDNLAWTCRPCNQKVAAIMKAAGVGRPTNQYNPRRRKKGISDWREWVHAISITKGEETGDVQKAIEHIRDTPPARRHEMQIDAWQARKAKYGPSGRKDGGALPF